MNTTEKYIAEHEYILSLKKRINIYQELEK